MEFFNSAFDLIRGTALPFLFVLGIVVFFHELGHFAVARWCGVKVDVFSVGFGRELIGRYDKHGTRWRLSLIPLGGYVKFAGDENAASIPDRERIAAMSEEERAGAFIAKPVWQRAAVVAAGPIANFLLAITIFAIIFMSVGRIVITPVVDTVAEGSAAEAAGMQAGDVILAVDNKEIATFSQLQRIVSVSADLPLVLDVDRMGSVVTLTVTPKYSEIKDRFGNVQRVGLLGVGRSPEKEDLIHQTFGPIAAIAEGAKETAFVTVSSLDYLWGMVAGRHSTDQLGGPIRIAKISGDVAKEGFLSLVSLAAVLSIGIGILNLLPIPVLDGGHLLYFLAEAVRGKPLSERVQDLGFRIGLGLLLMLMVFVTWNDVLFISNS